MKCKLTLVSTKHKKSPVREGEIEGFCESFPQLSSRCVVFHNYPDKPDLVRVVSTSPIQKMEVLEDNTVQFETLNSTYRWERLTGAT